VKGKRTSTWPREYAKNRAKLLAMSDLCGLCLHGGAKTADHIISWRLWPRDHDGRLLPGFNSLGNLQPAHGTMGAGLDKVQNRCPTCGRLCNQSKGAGNFPRRAVTPTTFPEAEKRPASRQWFPLSGS
jgi:hypothetical protein